MSRLKLWSLGVVTASVLAAGPMASAQSPEVWITMGRDAATQAARSLARDGRPEALRVDTDGAIVVARIREDDIPLLARVIHEDLRRCGGFIAHVSRAEALEAVAREASRVPIPSPITYTIDNGPVVQALLADLQEANIRATIINLSAFFTRYYSSATGQDSAASIRDLWTGYAQGRSDVSIQTYSHPTATSPQPSIVLTIHGTTLASEVVVLGGHQDSINGATGRAPGADDDASGVATISEVLRVALASGYRPARTVKFMAYAAEEVGLRGSRNIAARFKAADVNVVGALQYDMTNFKGTPSADIVMITDFTNAAQNTFMGQLVDAYVGLPRTTSVCGYACSDHAAWTEQGYVSSFPFEAVFGQHMSQIHTANDTIAQSGNNANHALKFAKLGVAYLAEMAKGDLTPALNAPPTTSAGTDTTVFVSTPVTLTATATDTDGPGRLAYEWLQISGPQATLAKWNRRVVTFTPTQAGTYVFRVAVNDGAGTAVDDVTVTVTF